MMEWGQLYSRGTPSSYRNLAAERVMEDWLFGAPYTDRVGWWVWPMTRHLPSPVVCPACGREQCLDKIIWPDPEDCQLGEWLELWTDCNVDRDDVGDFCVEPLLLRRQIVPNVLSVDPPLTARVLGPIEVRL